MLDVEAEQWLLLTAAVMAIDPFCAERTSFSHRHSCFSAGNGFFKPYKTLKYPSTTASIWSTIPEYTERRSSETKLPFTLTIAHA
jgi:hypothetical protein